MKNANKSLSFYLTRTILTGAILVISCVLIYTHLYTRSVLLKNIQDQVEALTTSVMQRIEVVEQAVVNLSSNMRGTLENQNFDEEELYYWMRALLNDNPEIYGLSVCYEPFAFNQNSEYFGLYYYRKNNILDDTRLDEIYTNYTLEDWYQVPALTGKALWLEPYFGQAGQTIMTSYSQPFYSRDGSEIKGVVIIDVTLESLSEMIENIKILDSGYGYIISGQGTFIIHPQKRLIMNETLFTLSDDLNDPVLKELGYRMTGGEKGYIFNRSVVSRKMSQISFTPFHSADWSFGTVVPLDELYADINTLNRWILLLVLTGLTALFFIIRTISRRITKPLIVLAGAAEKLGQGELDISIPLCTLKDETGILNKSFRDMQEELKTFISELRESTAEKERYESELRIAREIQMSIIPKSFPPFPDRHDMEIYAVIHPAKAVGGDLYDFFFIDEDRLAFTIGDVSGKGVPASLFMAVTRTLFRAGALPDLPVNTLVERLNEALCVDNDTSMFVTLFAGIMDLKTGEIKYCNAGHNPPVCLKPDESRDWVSDRHGVPLGVMEGMDYGVSTLTLKPGEKLFLYTDGVTEAENIGHELFQEERLLKVLSSMPPESDSEEMILKVYNAVKNFTEEAEQSDDITMLCLSFFGHLSEIQDKTMKKNRQFVFQNELKELNKLSEKLEMLGEEWELSPGVVMNMNLALEELVTNTIFYGIKDENPHVITVSFELDKGVLSVEIRDDGIPFNPLDISEPDLDVPVEERKIGGLGIYLVKKVMDDFKYCRDGSYNVITLKKKL
jgi:phosphoserine phosphatase RsbU/P